MRDRLLIEAQQVAAVRNVRIRSHGRHRSLDEGSSAEDFIFQDGKVPVQTILQIRERPRKSEFFTAVCHARRLGLSEAAINLSEHD